MWYAILHMTFVVSALLLGLLHRSDGSVSRCFRSPTTSHYLLAAVTAQADASPEGLRFPESRSDTTPQ